MRNNWMLVAIAMLLAILAVAAVACDDDDGAEGDEDVPAATEEAAPTEDAREDGAEGEAEEGTEPAAATVVVSEHPELGRILTDADGRTLYTFAEDQPNATTCVNDPCPQTWPPLTIETGTPVAGEGVPGQLGVIQRPDGSLQVSYNGLPLHRFVNDTAPGDANGQGVGGRWFVVQVGG